MEATGRSISIGIRLNLLLWHSLILWYSAMLNYYFTQYKIKMNIYLIRLLWRLGENVHWETYFIFFSFLKFIYFNWRLITLQYCTRDLFQYIAEKKCSRVGGPAAAAVAMAVGANNSNYRTAETCPSHLRKLSAPLSICPYTIQKEIKAWFFFSFSSLFLRTYPLLQW